VKQWQAMALIVALAPPVALGGMSAGLLPRSPAIPLWYLLLAAPLWEESFFRGILQQYLMGRPAGCRRFMGFSLANWTAGCCFSAVHLPFQGIHALGILLPALALGWLFERTARILPCVLLHGWFNLSWLIAGRIMTWYP
jgi:membrane protease YdiL (CAAX protease family)